jgi:peptidoglycan L-alanyl-D-glutamate endopeptidase CwlK
MSLGKKQEIFSKNLHLLVAHIYDLGFQIRRGECHRPYFMQQHYVRTGRSKTLKGRHPQKMAADLFIFKDGKWISSKEELQGIGDYWESLDCENEWGGNWTDFVDTPHFEKRR